MKPDIHPEYADATITCACGQKHQTKSTKGDYGVDICAACHPFYTGKQKLMDTAGRVERFKKKYAKLDAHKAEAKARAEAKAAKAEGPGDASADAPAEATAADA